MVLLDIMSAMNVITKLRLLAEEWQDRADTPRLHSSEEKRILRACSKDLLRVINNIKTMRVLVLSPENELQTSFHREEILGPPSNKHLNGTVVLDE